MNLQKQADRLLYDFGLLKIIEAHGTVHIVGSYKMNMMIWNDLDINIESKNHSLEGIYRLAGDINDIVKPYRFEGIYNNKDDSYFYGCETNVSGERWNIDIWLRNKSDIIKTEMYCDNIIQQVSADPNLGNNIMTIKKELIKMGLYGIDKSIKRHYHSNEIYDAVLNDNIQNIDEFIKKYPKQ